jgi:CBS domain-containing protein
MLTLADLMELLIEFYSFLTKEEFEASLDIVTLREWNRTRRVKPVAKKPDAAAGAPAPPDDRSQAQGHSSFLSTPVTISFSSSSPSCLSGRTPLIFIHPEASLFDTSRALLQHRIHRGPVLDTDTNTVLHIITHARIIRYLVSNVSPFPLPLFPFIHFVFFQWITDRRILTRTLSELRLGTFENLESISESASVIDALQRMHSRRISAIPLLDANGVVVGLYAVSDIRYLPLTQLYNALQVPVGLALLKRHGLNVRSSCSALPISSFSFSLSFPLFVSTLSCLRP